MRKTKDDRLQKTYGITLEQYEQMYEAQGGVCDICKQPETRVGRGGAVKLLCVDHNAKTAQVRALLCAACNLALGCLREDPDLFAAASAYIQKWNA